MKVALVKSEKPKLFYRAAEEQGKKDVRLVNGRNER